MTKFSVLILVFLFASTNLSANKVYVDCNSINEDDGSKFNPYLNISKALTTVEYGDTVLVAPGFYQEKINLPRGVALIGIDGAVNTEIKPIESLAVNDNSLLKGFTISTIEDFPGPIEVKGRNSLITENIFINKNPLSGCTAIWGRDASCTITKNYITGFAVAILFSGNSSFNADNNVIESREVSIIVGGDANATIINNTILFDDFGAVRISNYASAVASNNIIEGPGTKSIPAIYLSNIQATIKGNYNVLYNTNIGGGEGFVNYIYGDPKFEAPLKHDYRLKPDSPGIDAGAPDSTYTDTDGTRNDAGAFGGPNPISIEMFKNPYRSIELSNSSGFPGDTLSLLLSLDNLAGIKQADFDLTFDSSLLELNSVVPDTATENSSIEFDEISVGSFSINLLADEEFEKGEDLLQLVFIINSEAKKGDASSIYLKNLSLKDSDGLSSKIKQIKNGHIIVNEIDKTDNTIFVKSDYRGTETGSSSKPFNTIQEAVDFAEPNDTIFVMGGNYPADFRIEKDISLIGAGIAVTKILKWEFDQRIVLTEAMNGIIKNFSFEYIKSVGDLQAIMSVGGNPQIINNRFIVPPTVNMNLEFFYNSNILLEGNVFENVYITTYKSEGEIRNNRFFSDSFEIFMMSDSKYKIINNLFEQNAGGGISLKNSDSSYISNNIFRNETNSSSIYLRECSNVNIVNNTLYNGRYGIMELDSESKILNNIIVNNTIDGLKLGNLSNVEYNNLWNNAEDIYNSDKSLGVINYDPQFTDAEGGNFQLSSGSHCIDTGAPDPAFNDLDGSRNDLGAFGGPLADTSWIIDNDVKLNLDSVFATGNKVEIPVKVNNLSMMSEFEFLLNYDPYSVSLNEIQTVSSTKNFAISKSFLTKSKVKVKISSYNGVRIDDNVLLNITFDKVESGKSSSEVIIDEPKILDGFLNEIPITEIHNGSIIFEPSAVNDKKDIPSYFALKQNYPNPFNPSTTIEYSVPDGSINIQIEVFNILGEKVSELINEYVDPGNHSIIFNPGSQVSSGIYIYRMKAVVNSNKRFIDVKKMVYLK